MKTGIFINIEDGEELLSLCSALKCETKYDVATLLRQNGKTKGYLIRPLNACQIYFEHLWKVFSDYTEESYYTLPNMHCVTSPGVGILSKSLYVHGQNISLTKVEEFVKKICESQIFKDSPVIFVEYSNGEQEVFATSPLDENSSIADYWQKTVSRICKEVFPKYQYTFSQTWSTNSQIIEKSKGLGRTISEEKKKEFAKYNKK